MRTGSPDPVIRLDDMRFVLTGAVDSLKRSMSAKVILGHPDFLSVRFLTYSSCGFK